MSKMETVYHGYHISVDRFADNEGIPHCEKYRVTTFNDDNHWHDEITLTDDQLASLKRFFLHGSDGIICKPFQEVEIDKEFQPRFGGANPDYIDFYRSGWEAAFAYVNKKIMDSMTISKNI